MNKKFITLTSLIVLAIIFALTSYFVYAQTPDIRSPIMVRSAGQMIQRLGSWLFWTATTVALLMIAISGYFFVTSGGDPGKVRNAKKILISSLIGFSIIIISSGIVSLIALIVGVDIPTLPTDDSISLFSPPVENTEMLTPVEVNIDKNTSGNLYKFNTKPIYAISFKGNIGVNSPSGFVRIVLTDAQENKYLLHESRGPYDQGINSFENFCQETCVLNGIMPKSVDVEIESGTIKLEKLFVLEDYNNFKNEVKEKDNTLTYGLALMKKQERKTIQKINNYNKKRGIGWSAGETGISNYTFEQKKSLLGVQEDGVMPNLMGFEYYKGGIFELYSNSSQRIDTTTFDNSNVGFPANFDWRNQHGKNWITPVKNQNFPVPCGSCWIFATTGAIEAVANLYYNEQLGLNLSEQDILSCGSNRGCSGDALAPAVNYYQSKGITSGQCFPYAGTRVSCQNKCSNWQNYLVSGTGSARIENNAQQWKNALINKGPLTAGGFWRTGGGQYAHAMTFVGYQTTNAKETILIFKNSWGSNWGEGGYLRVKDVASGGGMLSGSGLFQFVEIWSIGTPVRIASSNNLQVKCTDADKDGYCFWGIGPKPSFRGLVPKTDTCSKDCKTEPDCDDSNPALGPWGDCLAKDPGPIPTPTPTPPTPRPTPTPIPPIPIPTPGPVPSPDVPSPECVSGQEEKCTTITCLYTACENNKCKSGLITSDGTKTCEAGGSWGPCIAPIPPSPCPIKCKKTPCLSELGNMLYLGCISDNDCKDRECFKDSDCPDVTQTMYCAVGTCQGKYKGVCKNNQCTLGEFDHNCRPDQEPCSI